MTIPLLLAEAIPLEIRNILKSLKKGMKVKLKDGDVGTINFICDQYVLVYPADWDDIYIEDEHFYNHKNYKGYIREHPGNEDLPTDITGMDK